MRAIISEAMTTDSKALICSDFYLNLIYFADLKTGNVFKELSVPNEAFASPRLIGDIKCFDDFVIFIPYHARKIWIYDLSNHLWNSIDLIFENCTAKFWNSCIYEKKLFLIPARYPYIVQVDLTTLKVNEFYDLRMQNSNAKFGYFFSDYVVDDDTLYLASCSSNHLLAINLNKLSFEWITVGDSKNMFSGVVKVGDCFWLSPRRNTPLIRYDFKHHDYYEYSLPEDFSDDYHFLGITKLDDIYLPGIHGYDNLVFSSNDESFSNVGEKRAHVYSGNIGHGIYAKCFRDGDLIILQNDLSNNIRIHVNDKEERRNLIESKYVYNKDVSDEIVMETSGCDFPLFISRLK